MTINKISKLIFLTTMFFVLAFVVNAQSAFACSCMMPGTPGQELKESTTVFSGTVVSIDRDSAKYGNNIRFDVEKIWKGSANKTIAIFTGMGPADCGYGFVEGEKYLVYAFGDDGSLSTGICSRTKLLSAAKDDLSALGEGKGPDAATKSQSNFPNSSLFLIIFVAIILILIVYKVLLSRQKRFSNASLIVLIVILMGILGYLILAKPFALSRQAADGASTTEDIGDKENIFCTKDAKVCPDGSVVGRIPPKCEFTACPISDNSDVASCAIENCHGLDIKCGSNPPDFCTAIYMMGDKCLKYAECGVQNGECQQIDNSQFIQCKSCVQKCADSNKNDPIKVFECESECK